MKKVISVLLVCAMIFLGTATVFATETDEAAETYDTAELFADYDEKSLSEMVRYINENQEVYGFIEYFRNHGSEADLLWPETSYPEITIYMSGNYKSSEVWGAFCSKFTDELSKYIEMNLSRPQTPDASTPIGTVMLGEKGTKCFMLDFTDEFFSYIKTLDRLDGNVLIMDLLMNLLSGDVVGISFNWNDVNITFEGSNTSDGYISEGGYSSFAPAIIGDCNGDSVVNAADGYLTKLAVIGNDNNNVDPFAVDINTDGHINAADSFALRKKIVEG